MSMIGRFMPCGNPGETETYEIQQIVETVKGRLFPVIWSSPVERVARDEYTRFVQDNPDKRFQLVKKIQAHKEETLAFTMLTEEMGSREKEAIFDLAMLALSGSTKDVVMLVKRLAHRYRNDDRTFSDRLTALLPDGSFDVLRRGAEKSESPEPGIVEKSRNPSLRDFRSLFGREVQEGDEVEILDGWAPYSKGVVMGIGSHGVILIRDKFGVDYEVFADGYKWSTDLRVVWPSPNGQKEVQ